MPWQERLGRVRFGATIAAGLLTGVLVSMVLWAQVPEAVEVGYVEGLGPIVQAVLVAVTGRMPFSFAEWIEIAAIGVGIVALGSAGVLLWRGTGRRVVVAGELLLSLWVTGAAIGVLFYVTWGLSYARPPAMVRLGWSTGAARAPLDLDVLETIGEDLVQKVNALYLRVHGWPDGLTETEAPAGGMPATDAAIDRGYERLVAEMGLHKAMARPRGPTKALRTSLAFSYLGIGGFYFPFTGEANINVLAPDWQLPHTIAHEKAHQRFVASENEANFFGFLACVYTDQPYVQYGGWLFAERQVLATLQKHSDVRFRRVITRRYPGVQRDVLAARAFWAQFEGPVALLGDAVNDRYLRFNGVEGGVRSYSQSLELIVAWWTKGGGSRLGCDGACR